VPQRRRVVAAIGFAFIVCCARAAAAQDDRPFAGVVDRDMTPSAGTLDLLTAQRALATVEDRWLPASMFDESRWFRHALGIGYRFGRWYGLDLPQDHFLMVVGHEIFGHGARLREIGARHVAYSFSAPIPYGGGGAVTSFSGGVLATRGDALAVDSGGIEAQNTLADHIERQALLAGRLHHREAWMYLESRLDGLRYIRSVSPRSSEGHDIRSFLLDFNDGCTPPLCTPLDGPTLKRRAFAMLADPMLAYAGYSWAVSYLVRGRTVSAVPMIPLPHDVRYLPALRFEMTPYGTAVTTDHNLLFHRRLATVSIGVGDSGRARAWDVGVAAIDLLQRARLRADVALHLWRQPSLDTPPDAQVMTAGAFAAATARIPLGGRSGLAARTGVLVQAGYKSDGFVRGERLHAGPVLRVGLTLQR
jgi:hypothetical protein